MLENLLQKTPGTARIVASVPGRLRVRDAGLRNPLRMARLEATLAGLEGISSIECNPRIGSVILHYGIEHTDMDAFESQVERAVDAELRAARPTGNRSLRVKVNRVAKAGMLSSLAASLALVAAGNKKWHAVSGGVFVACLGVHLGIHRRHILR